MEERDSYILENWSYNDIEPNRNGERIVAVAKVDDRLVKREPMEEDESLISNGKQKKITFIDLTIDE